MMSRAHNLRLLLYANTGSNGQYNKKKKQQWMKKVAYLENTKKISFSLQAYVLIVDRLVQWL